MKRVIHKKKCPRCNDGELTYDTNAGIVLTSNPPLYPHKCNGPRCNNTANFTVRYPYDVLEFEPHETIVKWD